MNKTYCGEFLLPLLVHYYPLVRAFLCINKEQIVKNVSFLRVHIQLLKTMFLYLESTEDSEKLVKLLKFGILGFRDFI